MLNYETDEEDLRKLNQKCAFTKKQDFGSKMVSLAMDGIYYLLDHSTKGKFKVIYLYYL